MEKIKKYLQTQSVPSIILKVFLLWFILTFVIFPNVNLLMTVFIKDGKLSTDAFMKTMNSARAMNSLMNSFILAITLSITVNIVGCLTVLFTEYFDIKGSKFLKIAFMTSLVYGGVTLVTGYKFFYGANGFFTNFLLSVFPSMNPNWFVGYGAVVFVMTFACTSNHMMFLTSAIRGIDYHTIEAAKNMGASSGKIFFKIVLPTLKPTLFAITILTFLTGLGAMSAPLMVGGSNFQTINPMIMTFASSSYSREVAAMLAILLGIMTIILLMVFTKIEKKGNYISISKTKAKIRKQKIHNPWINWIMHIIAYLMFIVYMAPIVLVIIYSFCDGVSIKTATITLSSFTLANYVSLFKDANSFRPYVISTIYAIVAALSVTGICLVTARIVHKSQGKFAKLMEYGVLVPWLLPSTLIALGLMLTYNTPQLAVGNKTLVGTTVLLLLAYIVVKLPFSFRMIKASMFSLDPNIEEAAKSMGASSFKIMFKIIVPILLPVLLAVIVLNFNSLISEYDLTVFLYHPLFKPLGIVIKGASDETATTAAQSLALVYSVVLMIISSVTLWIGRGNGIQVIGESFKKLSFKKG